MFEQADRLQTFSQNKSFTFVLLIFNFVRLYIFIQSLADCTWLSTGRELDCQTHHFSILHSVAGNSHCATARAERWRNAQSLLSAPNEAEEMCRTISFDFPTVQLTSMAAWFPHSLRGSAFQTIRLHVQLLSTILNLRKQNATRTGCEVL